ncbi:SMC-Scp complex subunit ScpB [Silvibacterium sp.]|uniref:SMC-Scp complex subunit ScpB n=1 Tax=Silvibacterium sp. TaxID=1964179 RepID=UPI0039E6A074
MSLKAKIEAVIYASEEPVTVAQLAALFSDEVAEHRIVRLRDAAEARAAAEAASVSAEAAEPSDVEVDAQLTELAVGQVDDPETSDEAADAAAEVLETAAETAEESEEATAEPEAAEAGQAEAEESVAEEESEEESQETESDVVETAEAAEAAETVDPTDLMPSAALTPEDERRLARQRDRELREEVRLIMAELMAEYIKSERGMEIREIAGGYRVATKPEYHDAVRSFVKSLKPPLKLSLQALETLAVIAYKQPVTAPEVAEIRGVDSGGVLGSLVSRKLITTAGRKQVVGRPILYKTTKEFLLRFGLKDLGELPSLEEFEKMAGELAEAEDPIAENTPLPFDEDETEEAPEVEVVDVEAAAEIEPVAEGEVAAAAEAEVVEAEKAPATEGTIPTHVAKPIVVTEYEEAEADLPSIEAHVEVPVPQPAEEHTDEAEAGEETAEVEKEEA